MKKIHNGDKPGGDVPFISIYELDALEKHF